MRVENEGRGCERKQALTKNKPFSLREKASREVWLTQTRRGLKTVGWEPNKPSPPPEGRACKQRKREGGCENHGGRKQALSTWGGLAQVRWGGERKMCEDKPSSPPEGGLAPSEQAKREGRRCFFFWTASESSQSANQKKTTPHRPTRRPHNASSPPSAHTRTVRHIVESKPRGLNCPYRAPSRPSGDRDASPRLPNLPPFSNGRCRRPVRRRV